MSLCSLTLCHLWSRSLYRRRLISMPFNTGAIKSEGRVRRRETGGGEARESLPSVSQDADRVDSHLRYGSRRLQLSLRLPRLSSRSL